MTTYTKTMTSQCSHKQNCRLQCHITWSANSNVTFLQFNHIISQWKSTNERLTTKTRNRTSDSTDNLLDLNGNLPRRCQHQNLQSTSANILWTPYTFSYVYSKSVAVWIILVFYFLWCLKSAIFGENFVPFHSSHLPYSHNLEAESHTNVGCCVNEWLRKVTAKNYSDSNRFTADIRKCIRCPFLLNTSCNYPSSGRSSTCAFASLLEL